MTRSAFGRFLRSYEERAVPLNREANEAYWAATTTGRPEDQEACAAKTAALRRLHSDPAEYARLKGWQTDKPADPLEARQLEILLRLYTEQQLAPEVIEELARREQEIQSLFTSFRPEFEGRTASENDLRQVLAEDQDVGRRRAAWEASKLIGAEAAPRLLALAEQRNRAARSIGFRDFFQLRLTIDELPEGPLFELLDDLERRTAGPYVRAKAKLDEALARRFGAADREELRPWHYADLFFQEAPAAEGLDLDRLFSGKDVVELSRSFYSGLGLEVDDILGRSDLFERPGKNQHGYCIDIDREGDVRVLANVRPGERWMGTMLHELGHASYSKHHDRKLPFLLRDAAHMFTTEAVAILMEHLTASPDWLARQAGVPERETQRIAGLLAAHLRLARLIFVRWGLVMVRFERELYRDPGQDLNGLWWDLVRRLQQLTPPEGRDRPDYASKIHLGIVPVYYQNYLLGTLAASQLGKALLEAGERRAGLVGDLRAGAFLREKVFAVGARYPWNEMLRRATGQTLSAEPFLAEFAG